MTRPFDAKTTGRSAASTLAAAVKDRTILITGVNSGGLGGKTAEAIAAQGPRTLILASRTASKIEEVIDTLRSQSPDSQTKYVALSLDLSSQESCRKAAKTIMDDPEVEQIDVVINNAGTMRLPRRQLSREGIELQFATNHVGHFLFTNLIMDKVISAARANRRGVTRIVNVSSLGAFDSPVRFSDVNFEVPLEDLPEDEQPNWENMASQGILVDRRATYHENVAYAQSKSANILFSLGLNARLYERYGILSLALHPGVIFTELLRHLPTEVLEQVKTAVFEGQFQAHIKDLDRGCATSVVAAFDDTLQPPDKQTAKGVYLTDGAVVDAPVWAQNWENAAKLWALSEDLVGEQFHY